MRLRLPSGKRILVSPLLPWEFRRNAWLTMRTTGAFHPSHVTTRLCLELLEEHLGTTPCDTLVDVGCGCGVLALAAAAMGVKQVVGVDIDLRAVRLARTNARSNGFERSTHWIAGSSTAVRNSYQCVVANLPVVILEGLLDDLGRLMVDHGKLILSGFEDVHWPTLQRKLRDRNLKPSQVLSGDFTFYGIPPSGSFTWMAITANREFPCPDRGEVQGGSTAHPGLRE